MGIQGLLPLLKSIERPVHLKDYAGQTLAVDGYVWLHKGAFACAQELCLGQPTEKYVTYFMRKIEMFKFFRVKPYIVFDGGYLPSKAVTEQDRESRREESKKQAMDLLQSGKSKQALEQFRKCVDVTPEMAFAVIQALEAARIDFVVAPYEADAQLAYLEKKGVVDGIVTEDSDLIVFGCRKVIFKLDQYGAGIEILHENLNLVREVSFHGWTMTEIRHMCIMAGCDYLPSIPGMGLKTAQRLLRRFKTFERAIKHVRMESTGAKIQADYEDSFRKADLTFLYARVYDPVSKSMVHLNPVPEELEELVQTEEYDFLGPILENNVMRGIATGKLDPISKTALSCPAIQRPVQRLGQPFSGKENKPVSGISPRPSLQSTKSIHSYMIKTSTLPSTVHVQAKDTAQKREPLRDAGAVAKKRVLEKYIAPAPSTSIVLVGSSVAQEKSAVADSITHNVVVEARSRFFGFEMTSSSSPQMSETVDKAQARSFAVREDSGIGLDEASLMYTSEITSVQQGDEPRSTDMKKSSPSKPVAVAGSLSVNSMALKSTAGITPSEASLEYKKPNAKVIEGWREKFSNPSGSGAGPARAPGLTRALEGGGCRVKSILVSSKSSKSSKKQIMDEPAEATRIGAGLDTQQGGTVVVRSMLGHPTYPSDTARWPVGTAMSRLTSKSSGVKSSLASQRPTSVDLLAQSKSGPLSQATDDDFAGPKPTPALNLDRFKYTPVAAAPQRVTTAETSPG